MRDECRRAGPDVVLVVVCEVAMDDDMSRTKKKWTDRGLIPGPPECKSGVIPLHHPPGSRVVYEGSYGVMCVGW